MKYNKFSLICLSAFIFINMQAHGSGDNNVVYGSPYGINAWNWPLSTCKFYRDANFTNYRVMVSWGDYETSKSVYDWNTQTSLNEALDSANKNGAKLSLCIYDSPLWARSRPEFLLSYKPEDYAEFAEKCLQYCESRYKGLVEAVEVENENPTGTWVESELISHGTWQRDASWNYANILKQTSLSVRKFNREHGTDILVIPDAIWTGAFHHLDDLYQLGCRDYFDRLNFHYYVNSPSACVPEDPSDKNTIWQFNANIKYLKYIAKSWDDANKSLWITEYGWRYDLAKNPEFEEKRVKFNNYVMDMCRKSGIVEKIFPYVGAAHWGTPPNDFNDGMDILYVDNHKTPSWHTRTPLYNMYVDFDNKYKTWGTKDVELIDTLPAATTDVNIFNGDFENGTVDGWINVKIDKQNYHDGIFSGKQDAPGELRTFFYPIEKGKLYEVTLWVKITADNPGNFITYPSVIQQIDDIKTNAWAPANYYGISDTRNYPGGWRKLRFMYFTPENIARVAFKLESKGKGTLWVDDLQINALSF